MDLLASFFNRSRPFAPMTTLPLPSPVENSSSRFEQVRQYMHKAVREKLEKENGYRPFQMDFSPHEVGLTSFQGKTSVAWYALTTTLQILLISDLRKELNAAGWHVVSCCFVEAYILRICVIRATNESRFSIRGPREVWPHLQSKKQLLEIAQQDLIRLLADAITSKALETSGALSLSFAVGIPRSCESLNTNQMGEVLVSVRDRISEKWSVDRLEIEGDTFLQCVVSWGDH